MSTFAATAEQGETLDGLCWRMLGQTAGIVEQALELNRELADIGAVLPEGMEVILPVPVTPSVQQRDIVKLWD